MEFNSTFKGLVVCLQIDQMLRLLQTNCENVDGVL